MPPISNAKLLRKLCAEINQVGSMRKWAIAHGFEPAVVSKSMYAPTIYPAVAAALGYEKSELVWKEKKQNGQPSD